MGRLRFERVLDCFSFPNCCTSYLCANAMEDELCERVALIKVPEDQKLKLGDHLNNACKTLAFHLEPKTVVLRVSMHCNGCARKVEKHISKMEGVTSFEVDLQSKKVVVVGDINPFEVLDSVSKIKFAELCLFT
ncbi:Copper chaperone domain-containing protein [Dioscorea alata]|uniref:Copper chaperone domain-containing protein n=1 Tax=Dioscorea alata TaxID=55571 RepID=A0ACB7W3C8_DIOAL|nr:Copper chaperone domain-containing protein [Dioscorea alata]